MLPATTAVKILLLEWTALGLHSYKTNHSRKLGPVLQEPWLAAAQPETAGKQPPVLSSRRSGSTGNRRPLRSSQAKPKRAAGQAELSSPETLEQGWAQETQRATLLLHFLTRLGAYGCQG